MNAPTKSPHRIGDVVAERYQLVEVIGRGGQGVVYRALDRWLQRAVAIKILGESAVREQHAVDRLLREQQAMSALTGTAAVELLDVCRGEGGELCLVMELLAGVDLDEHLSNLEQRGKRMSLERVAVTFEPIVSTLETAHAAGILHRDLKPANLFLLDAGGVRLLDFGLARLKQSTPLTAAGAVMGSPSFMAPEAWQGVSDLLDQRADVYSLGVVLFLVLTGSLPFAGTSLQEKYARATSGARPSLLKLRPDLPRGADDWAAMALALDREQRFSNVRALWNAFRAAILLQSSPSERRTSSIWATAKGAVAQIVRSYSPLPMPRSEPMPSVRAPQSYTSAALARSVPQSDPTIQLSDADELQPFSGPTWVGPPAPVTRRSSS